MLWFDGGISCERISWRTQPPDFSQAYVLYCKSACGSNGIAAPLLRYAETGKGRVKPLAGEFDGLLRLRAGNHRVLFDEPEDTITVHRVSDRKEAYR